MRVQSRGSLLSLIDQFKESQTNEKTTTDLTRARQPVCAHHLRHLLNKPVIQQERATLHEEVYFEKTENTTCTNSTAAKQCVSVTKTPKHNATAQTQKRGKPHAVANQIAP